MYSVICKGCDGLVSDHHHHGAFACPGKLNEKKSGQHLFIFCFVFVNKNLDQKIQISHLT